MDITFHCAGIVHFELAILCIFSLAFILDDNSFVQGEFTANIRLVATDLFELK